ncbi:MAG: hypothetical protein LBJ63_06265 [Prevotellaceae bacterium]|jgi:hypothetical protein|nr:hypothetical protein [Prevotellaceae bacterium]
MNEKDKEESIQFIDKKEDEILNLLSKAHILFIHLPKLHPTACEEWRFYLHGLQGLIQHRICVRACPEIFTNNNN